MNLGDGIRKIWIVFAQEYDRSDRPQFLAAYDGESAREQAFALVDLIEKAGTYRNVLSAPVPLWPLIFANTGQPDQSAPVPSHPPTDAAPRNDEGAAP